MAAVTVEVRSRVVGLTEAELGLDPIQLSLAGEVITVAELIRRTVVEQVSQLLDRRRLEAQEARRILDRQYMTAEEIAAQAARGAVRPPSRKRRNVPPIDAEAEARNALDAFERRRYLVLVDGQQAQALEEEMILSPHSKVVFLRLTPLVGG